MSGDHHHHSHKHGRWGRGLERFGHNLSAGDHNPFARAALLVVNLSRRLLPPSDCCGHYGEPGC